MEKLNQAWQCAAQEMCRLAGYADAGPTAYGGAANQEEYFDSGDISEVEY